MILEYKENVIFRVFVLATERKIKKYPKESSAYISYDSETGDWADKGLMKHKSILENIKYNILTIISDGDLDMERTKICLMTGEVTGGEVKSSS